MIVTRDEVKTFLGITGTDYDTLIDTYIPIITEDIVEYCNNTFVAKDPCTYQAKIIYSKTNTIAFVDSNPDTITDSDNGFITAGFISGDDIYIEGTIRNNGHFTADTVEAGTLTLNDIDSLTAEDASENTTPTISLVIFPKPLKIVASQMIGYQLFQINDTRGALRESLGDYSVTYDKPSDTIVGGNMYPKDIIVGLAAYKYVRMS